MTADMTQSIQWYNLIYVMLFWDFEIRKKAKI